MEKGPFYRFFIVSLHKNVSKFHCCSIDEKPQHTDCPKQEESWCFYQHVLAKDEMPPSHSEKLITYLNEKVAEYVKLVYTRLADFELLEKVQRKRTQNNNESFHALLWARCPKHFFAARPRIEIATAFAVGEWNRGDVGTHAFIFIMGKPSLREQLNLARRETLVA